MSSVFCYIQDKKTRKTLMLFLFLIILFVIGILINIQNYFEYIRLMNSGDCNYIEGVVHKFDPQETMFSRTPESFYIDSMKFSYNHNSVYIGYNETMATGGKIRDNKYLKVYFYKEIILKIEMSE